MKINDKIYFLKITVHKLKLNRGCVLKLSLREKMDDNAKGNFLEFLYHFYKYTTLSNFNFLKQPLLPKPSLRNMAYSLMNIRRGLKKGCTAQFPQMNGTIPQGPPPAPTQLLGHH